MNQIYHNKIAPLGKEGTFYATIDGSQVDTEEKLLSYLEVIFEMPDSHNWDAVRDWLGDLDWLNAESYALTITNYSQLLEADQSSKEIFLEILQDTVEWWGGDVEKYVVGGKKKAFNVYLFD